MGGAGLPMGDLSIRFLSILRTCPFNHTFSYVLGHWEIFGITPGGPEQVHPQAATWTRMANRVTKRSPATRSRRSPPRWRRSYLLSADVKSLKAAQLTQQFTDAPAVPIYQTHGATHLDFEAVPPFDEDDTIAFEEAQIRFFWTSNHK